MNTTATMKSFSLSKVPTTPPEKMDKNSTEKKTAKLTKQLSDLQNILFAEAKHGILVVLQGMDASGKDGAIRHVFSGMNPLGCRVKGFKKPTEEEMKHDFLWRVHKEVPEKGMIQIFNRSHYEDVIIQRVHAWVNAKTIRRRYEHINAFEKLLHDNGTVVVKFYLHVSQKEQVERLSERLSDPTKKWKYNPSDLDESKRWDEYMEAYEDAFLNCGPDNQWHIIPSDKNWYKEYLISKKLVEIIVGLHPGYPEIKTV